MHYYLFEFYAEKFAEDMVDLVRFGLENPATNLNVFFHEMFTLIRRSHNGQNVFPAMALTEALIRVAREDAGRRPLHVYVTEVSYALDLLPYQQKSFNIYFLNCVFGV